MEFVFASVGFETTAPIYGIIIDELTKKKIKNLKLLVSLKTIIPALSFICENEKNIDGFLCPGHASVILGSSIYGDLVEKYNKPFVVAGFEGEHIIAAIYEIMSQLKNNKPIVKNLYTSTVSGEGNQKALGVINKYFEVTDDCWRGIGVIKDSGLKLRKEYMEFDAGSGFNQNDIIGNKEKGCRCTDVILGRINPIECPLFRKACTPLNAVGPCMVSSEGSCGIWYKNGAVK